MSCELMDSKEMRKCMKLVWIFKVTTLSLLPCLVRNSLLLLMNRANLKGNFMVLWFYGCQCDDICHRKLWRQNSNMSLPSTLPIPSVLWLGYSLVFHSCFFPLKLCINIKNPPHKHHVLWPQYAFMCISVGLFYSR